MTISLRSELLRDFAARGLIHDVTAGLDERIASNPSISGYIGFDPSANSLHVGHLMGVLALRRLQLAGGRPVALVGGGTGMIGDPSGRSAERNLLDRATLDAMFAKGKAAGIETRGISDHAFIDSIYFRDPNGYVIELTAKRANHDTMMNPATNGARAKLDKWTQGKKAMAGAA